ncbi:MAG: tandem-95 repeat protein [Acidobacteriota bacterium]
MLLDVLGNDSHSGGLPMTVSLDSVSNPAGGSVVRNADNTFTYQRASDYIGNFRFTYSVSDGVHTVSGIPVLVELFDSTSLPNEYAPIALDDSFVVPAGQPSFSLTGAALLANDSDPDPDQTALLWVDPLTLVPPQRGLLEVTATNPATGGVDNLLYTPNSDFFALGWDEFGYEAVDPDGHRGSATVRLFLAGWQPPNTPPTAQDHLIVVPQATRTFVPWAEFLAGAEDVDGDWLEVEILSQPDPADTRQWFVDDAGVVWQPRVQPVFRGQTSFDYRLFDGTDYSAPATVTFDVQEITDPPMAGYDGPFDVPKDGRLFIRFEVGAVGEPNLFGNDRSQVPDAPLLPINLAFGEPDHGRLDFCCNAAGFWYIPDDGYEGFDSFWYTVGDINFRSATAKVRLNVVAGAVDPPPTQARNDFLEVRTLGTTAFLWSDLLANDSGTNLLFSQLIPDAPNPLPLTYGQVELLSPGHDLGGGLPPADYDGALVYTQTVQPPDIDELDVVGYRAARGDDPSTSDAFAFFSWGQSPNYIAYNDLVTTAEGRATDIVFNHLLANDELSSYAGASPVIDPVFLSRPRFGEISNVGHFAGVIYRPPPGFVGADSFTYWVFDQSLQAPRVAARVVVVVEPGAPLPSYDRAWTYQAAALEIDALANDSDPQGDELRYVAVTQPTSGQVSIVGAGSAARLLYVPDPGYVGVVTFGYTVADPDGNQSSNAVEVEVVPNDLPLPMATVFCDGLRCRLDGSASSDDLGLLSYEWQVGAGPVSSPYQGESVLIDLAADGVYQVVLTVADVGGRTAQAVTTFTAASDQAGATPIAGFTYDCSNGPTCTFDASTSVDDVEITLFQWDFGGLEQRIGPQQTYTFPTSHGSYTVTLAVRDSSQQISTHAVTVSPAPEQ